MRKLKAKTKSPKTPWNTIFIKEERKLLREYGLRRKKELRSAEAVLREFRRRARQLIAKENKEEETRLLDKMKKFGFVTKENPTLDDVLALNIKDILNRRLQTIVNTKGVSKGIRHARQIILHGHVFVGDRRTGHPSYLVSIDEEDRITFAPVI